MAQIFQIFYLFEGFCENLKCFHRLKCNYRKMVLTDISNFQLCIIFWIAVCPSHYWFIIEIKCHLQLRGKEWSFLSFHIFLIIFSWKKDKNHTFDRTAKCKTGTLTGGHFFSSIVNSTRRFYYWWFLKCKFIFNEP